MLCILHDPAFLFGVIRNFASQSRYFSSFATQNPRYARPAFLRVHGGDEEDRTPDPLLARQVLSQLSYTPIMCAASQLNECGKFDEVRIFFLSAVYVGTQG